MTGCFGGGAIVPDMPTWQNKVHHSNSNMTVCWGADAARVLRATGAETTTTTTGGTDVTAVSISLPPGAWMVFGEFQTVNSVGATITEAACQLTTDNTASGKNRATNASFNFGSNDMPINPGSSANLRVSTRDQITNTTTGNVTLYLRSYMNISAGTLAYKGALLAIKLP
jgi:hypothetical protein